MDPRAGFSLFLNAARRELGRCATPRRNGCNGWTRCLPVGVIHLLLSWLGCDMPVTTLAPGDSRSLSLSLSLARSFSRSLARARARALSHVPTYALTHSPSLSHTQDAKGYDIAGAIMLEGNFAKVNFKEVTHTHTHTRACARAHTHTLILTHSYTHSLHSRVHAGDDVKGFGTKG